MKYLKYLLLIIPFMFISNVKADILSYKIQNRTVLPYDTYWSSNESYTYEYDQIEQSSQNRYMILRTCSTDYLDYSITSNSAGKITQIGNSVANTKCDTDGHSGWYIDYYFYIDSFYQTTGVYVNTFNLKVYNSRTYKVYQSLINLYTVPDLDTVPDYTDKLNGIQGGIDNTNKKIDQTNEELKKTNDNLTDSSIDTSNKKIEDKSADASKSPISSLLTLPLKILGNINTGLSGTCSPFSLGTMFGTELILPCINLENRLGSWLWGLIDSFFCIFLIYNVGMLAVKIWTDVIMMKDFFSQLYKPDSEKGDKKE